MIARRWQIYAIFSPEDGRPVYVGRTYGNPLNRINQHVRSAQNPHLRDRLRGWALKGLTPHVEIFEKGFGDCSGAERGWVARLRAWGYQLLNRSDGGERSQLLPHPIAHTREGERQGLFVRRVYEDLAQVNRFGFKRAKAY